VSEKKLKRDVSGWLVLDKPYGMTSTQAVGKVRWLFGAKKAGHAGTLDPLATGILPIALGEATKTVPVLQDGRKVYRFSILWGATTTTDDAEGAVVETSAHRPSEADVLAASIQWPFQPVARSLGKTSLV
jgi:tRNA pseudouridine55 synthase